MKIPSQCDQYDRWGVGLWSEFSTSKCGMSLARRHGYFPDELHPSYGHAVSSFPVLFVLMSLFILILPVFHSLPAHSELYSLNLNNASNDKLVT